MSRARGATVPEPSQLSDAQRERRARILDAALALSRHRPFEQIQMKDVAEASGVALGTMYQYFSSKDHLFAEALAHWGGLLEDNVRARPLVGDDPAQRLTEVLHRVDPGLPAAAQPGQAGDRAVRVLGPVRRRGDRPARPHRRAPCSGTHWSAWTRRRPESMVRMVDHVMAGTLRLWSAGRMSIVEVYGNLDEMVDLLFRP